MGLVLRTDIFLRIQNRIKNHGPGPVPGGGEMTWLIIFFFFILGVLLGAGGFLFLISMECKKDPLFGRYWKGPREEGEE